LKILVLDEEFPFPPNTGKRIRSYNLISRLGKNHEIHYLAYGKADSLEFNALKKAGLNPVAVRNMIPEKSGPLFYIRLAANLLSGLPYIVTSHHSRLFKDEMMRLLKYLSPDLILCEWTPYAEFARDVKNVPRVVSAHNVESRIWRRYFETETNPAKKWYIARQVGKLEKYEYGVFADFEGIAAVSRSDACEITDICPHARVEVVDNGVDLDYFNHQPQTVDENSLVFVGTMDWRPNQDAVTYFVKDIFPLIRAQKPSTRAVFVGRKPPEFIRAYNEIDGIEITGSVDDIRPFVHAAAVYIVPLRIGGGTRLKILDAMAMHKPIVSTLVGAEGLEVTDGENILLAESAAGFAERVVRLLDDRTLQSKLAAAGRALVESRYGWDSLAAKLDGFLRRW
jgi:sugar transferase (PEP-CTERM/EpsH1 system associated)